MKCRASILLIALPISVTGALVDYEKEVFPVLKDNCIPCHNKTTTKAALNMETPELMLKGGDTDVGIVVGNGEKSLIYEAAAGHWDSEMPPKTNKVGAVPLSTSELDLLKRWIDEGAVHQGAKAKVIAWEPLPPAFNAIYAVSMTPDGQFAAAARGNQISVYHLPTQSLVTKLTDTALIKSGLYKQPGVAHRDIVPAIAFSPDGNLLATGSYREVKLWKRTSTPPAAASTPPNAKLRLEPAASPDTVQLIDQPNGKSLRDFKHGAKITAFILAPDAQRLATAGEDHRINIWETATGKVALEITGSWSAERDISSQTRSAARAALESAWLAESISKTEKEIAAFDARLKKAQQLADTAKKDLDPKRKDAGTKAKAQSDAQAASKSLADQVAQLPKEKPDEALAKKLTDAQAAAEKAAADAKTAAQALKRVEATIAESAKEIDFLNKQIAAGKTQLAAIKANAGNAKQALESANAAKTAAVAALPKAMPTLTSLTFSPNGLEIHGVTAEKKTLAWSTTTGHAIQPGTSACEWKLEAILGTGDGQSAITDRVASLAFSPDGTTLAVGSGEPSRSGDITLWEVPSGKLSHSYPETHLDTVLSLAFSPDGKHLASGGADKAVRVLNPITGKVSKVFEGHTHHVLGLDWRADGRVLASAGGDNVVKTWDWTIQDRRKNADGWDKEVTALRYLGAADLFATTSGDTKVRLMNSDGAEVKKLPGATDFMNAVSASADGELIIAGGQDGTLRVWQVSSGKELTTFK